MIIGKRFMVLCFAFTILPGMICSPGLAGNEEKKMKTPNPYMKPDESWISISGEALSTEADSFLLDYGKGTVKVEMDDWDWYPEGQKIIAGHKVRVYGQIDDDFFETTKIEASSVYDEELGIYFYASSADEEYYGNYDYWVSSVPVIVGQTVIRGTVTEVDGREFTVDTGLRKVTVDTSNMSYNPMDDIGYQKIDKGDYVSVAGKMEDTFWDTRELMADYAVTLADN